MIFNVCNLVSDIVATEHISTTFTERYNFATALNYGCAIPLEVIYLQGDSNLHIFPWRVF